MWPRLRYHRLVLFLYLIAIVIACLYLIIFVWIPEPGLYEFDKKTIPSAPSNVTKPSNVTTESRIFENATTKVTTNSSYLILEGGETQFINTSQKVEQKNATWYLQNTLDSSSKEVRLVSISALFGLLGGTVSGISSVLNRRIWDTGKYVNVRRLLYIYYSRPWIAMSVGIVTYVTLRAGLVNVGSASELTAISQYGVAAISGLVGLMTDEIIIRLRDIFRALFGITSLQREQELHLSIQKNSIAVNELTSVSAVLTDIKPGGNQNLVAYFFIQDANVVQIVPPTKREETFNSNGVATVTIRGNAAGPTYITVMLLGDPSLYDTERIEVT